MVLDLSAEKHDVHELYHFQQWAKVVLGRKKLESHESVVTEHLSLSALSQNTTSSIPLATHVLINTVKSRVRYIYLLDNKLELYPVRLFT